MGYKNCSLCKKWNSSTGYCSYCATTKKSYDYCSSIDLIPCCASCRNWSPNSDYMNKGNCSAHGGMLSPADSICSTGDYSSSRSSYSGGSTRKYKPERTTCNKWITFFLCLFLGCYGAHKFYEGNIKMGVIYLLTGGFVFIGVIIDLFKILLKPTTYPKIL